MSSRSNRAVETRDSPPEDENAVAHRPAADKVVSVLIAASIVALLAVFCFSGFRNVVLRFTQDDAFYYFEIARRVGLGEGSTWDGLTRTNGYHPLWLILLVPFAHLSDRSREIGARAMLCFCVVLLAASLLLLGKLLRNAAPRQAHLGVLYAWAALIASPLYGMESMLAIVLLVWMLDRAVRAASLPSSGNMAMLGLSAGLLILSRLDAIVYAAAMDVVLAAHLWKRRDDRAGRAIRVLLLPQLAIVAGYLSCNWLSYGHLLTVSAVVKAGRHAGFSLVWVKSSLALLALVNVLLAIASVRLARAGALAIVVRIAAAGTCLSMFSIALMGTNETLIWYFALPVFCGGIFVCAIASELVLRLRLLPAAIVCGCGVLAAASLAARFDSRKPDKFLAKYDRAVWIARNVPEDAVFAESDCGILGYLSEHSVINLDGLTNSFGFQRAIDSGRISQWLLRTGFNSVCLPAGDIPARVAGVYAVPLDFRASMHGVTPHLYAVIQPVSASASPRFRLWHVVRLEPGSGK